MVGAAGFEPTTPTPPVQKIEVFGTFSEVLSQFLLVQYAAYLGKSVSNLYPIINYFYFEKRRS